MKDEHELILAIIPRGSPPKRRRSGPAPSSLFGAHRPSFPPLLRSREFRAASSGVAAAVAAAAIRRSSSKKALAEAASVTREGGPDDESRLCLVRVEVHCRMYPQIL